MISNPPQTRYEARAVLLTVFCGTGVLDTQDFRPRPKVVWTDWSVDGHHWVTRSSDRPAAFWDRLSGRRFGVGSLKSKLYFNLGNRVVTIPQRIQGSRGINDNVQLQSEKTSMFGEICILFHFLYYLLFTGSPLRHDSADTTYRSGCVIADIYAHKIHAYTDLVEPRATRVVNNFRSSEQQHNEADTWICISFFFFWNWQINSVRIPKPCSHLERM